MKFVSSTIYGKFQLVEQSCWSVGPRLGRDGKRQTFESRVSSLAALALSLIVLFVGRGPFAVRRLVRINSGLCLMSGCAPGNLGLCRKVDSVEMSKLGPWR